MKKTTTPAPQRAGTDTQGTEDTAHEALASLERLARGDLTLFLEALQFLAELEGQAAARSQ